jgi:hypothetical protein
VTKLVKLVSKTAEIICKESVVLYSKIQEKKKIFKFVSMAYPNIQMKLKNDFDENYLPRSLNSKNFFLLIKGGHFNRMPALVENSVQLGMLFRVKM